MKPRASRLAPTQPLVAWPNLVVTRGRRAVEVANPDFGRPQRYAPDVARVLDFFAAPRKARDFTKAFGAPASALAGLFDDLALVTPDELADAEALRRVQPRAPAVGAPAGDSLGLTDLLGARRATALLRDRWPHGFFTAPASRRFLAALDAIAALKDVPSLAAAWGAPVAAWGATAAHAASPSLMNVLYRRGFTLYLTEVERWVPALRGLADGLAKDLGLLPEHVTFQGFASRAGSGSAAHCDFDLNFNVQLRGRKTWWVADNRHVAHPRVAHAMGTSPHPDLLAYAKTPLPTRMPRDALRFETTRGSVVFLPRGIWHRTMAAAESFSLTCVLVPPSWLGLLAAELDRRLRAHEGFREYALGLWGDGATREAHRAHLASLVSALRGEVEALDPDALLTRWRGGAPPPASAGGSAAPPSP